MVEARRPAGILGGGNIRAFIKTGADSWNLDFLFSCPRKGYLGGDVVSWDDAGQAGWRGGELVGRRSPRRPRRWRRRCWKLWLWSWYGDSRVAWSVGACDHICYSRGCWGGIDGHCVLYSYCVVLRWLVTFRMWQCLFLFWRQKVLGNNKSTTLIRSACNQCWIAQ